MNTIRKQLIGTAVCLSLAGCATAHNNDKGGKLKQLPDVIVCWIAFCDLNVVKGEQDSVSTNDTNTDTGTNTDTDTGTGTDTETDTETETETP